MADDICQSMGRGPDRWYDPSLAPEPNPILRTKSKSKSKSKIETQIEIGIGSGVRQICGDEPIPLILRSGHLLRPRLEG
jgi:hypothetical protein